MTLRVVKHTADELVIRKTPFDSWAFGAILMAVGVVVAVLLMGTSAFECDRSTQRCLLEKSWLLQADRVTSYALADLKGARVAKFRDSANNRWRYRVEFLVGGERVRLTESMGSKQQAKQQAVQEIETFLANPAQQTVRVEQGGLFGALFALGFGVIGSSFFLFGTFGKFRFSVPEDSFTVTRWGLFGKQHRRFRLRDVTRVRSASMVTEQPANRGVIDLNSGESVRMTAYLSNTQPGAVRVVEALEAFLLKRPGR